MGARNDYGYVVEGKGRDGVSLPNDAIGSIGLDGSGLGASLLGHSFDRRAAGYARMLVSSAFLEACAGRYEPRHDVDSSYNRSSNSTPDPTVILVPQASSHSPALEGGREGGREKDTHAHARGACAQHMAAGCTVVCRWLLLRGRVRLSRAT